MKYVIKIPHGELRANSYNELVAKIKAEQQFWEGVDGFQSRPLTDSSYLQHWLNRYVVIVDDMLLFWGEQIERLKGNDGRNIKDFFPTFKEGVEESPDVPPSSSSGLAQIVRKCIENGDLETAFALLLTTSGNSDRVDTFVDQNQHNAAVRYWGFAKGLNAAVTNIEPALLPAELETSFNQNMAVVEEMIAGLGQSIEKVENDLHETRRRQNEAEEQISHRVKRLHGRAVRSIRSVLSKNRQSEKAREEQFSTMMETFEAHLRLKRPVKLWEERKGENETAAKSAWTRFIVGSVLFGVASFIVSVGFGDWIASTFVKTGCANSVVEACKGISPRGPLVISTILAATTVWLWFLRFQMKIYLSERHLALDARERMAFAETYLSLLKGGSVSRDHEAVVLQSLFRPTQDGIIKDEFGPDTSVAGVLSKALDGRQN